MTKSGREIMEIFEAFDLTGTPWSGQPPAAGRGDPRRAARRIRIEPAALMFFDPATWVLLRTRPNPLTPAETARLRGARPAGPPPQPPTGPARVQRRAFATGVIMVAGQKIDHRPGWFARARVRESTA